MTPKEKANEMYDVFFDTDIPDITKAHRLGKKYALIAVDEIISATGDHTTNYWEQVKQEIEKL